MGNYFSSLNNNDVDKSQYDRFIKYKNETLKFNKTYTTYIPKLKTIKE
tara:strand:- start:76 stop:219 length:144 start_codon:yes stop_codon:yes gene_type:complete